MEEHSEIFSANKGRQTEEGGGGRGRFSSERRYSRKSLAD